MVRRTSVGTRSKTAREPREYKDAMAEYRRLANYFKAATKILSKPEHELLSEFVQISKKKCQRLRRALDRQSGKQRSAA